VSLNGRSSRTPAALISAPRGVIWINIHSSGNFIQVKRRSFIGALAAGTFASVPRVVRAQQASVRRVGILTAGILPRTIPAALRDELRERGWVEGQNLVFERRGADGNSNRVSLLAAELVQMNLDVIVSFGAVAGTAIKSATTTIPIIATTGDPGASWSSL
jgi:putative ABC transport system substrate-binding protein